MLFISLIFVSIAAAIAWYFLRNDRGAKEPPHALVAAFGFGIFGLVTAVMLESMLLPQELGRLSNMLPLADRFYVAMGVGFIEEAVKFFPLALLLYCKPYFNEHTDGIIYFTLCGLAFGLAENIGYTFQLGASAGIARIILVPFFHAAGTGIIGYHLARAKVAHTSLGVVVGAFIGVAVLHGLYDFGLLSESIYLIIGSIMITLLMSMGLFLYYTRAGELDRQQGLGGVGGPESAIILPITAASKKAIAAFVLSVLGIIGWIIPVVGIALGIGGLVFGTQGLQSGHHKLAIAALILAVPVTAISVVGWVMNLSAH